MPDIPEMADMPEAAEQGAAAWRVVLAGGAPLVQAGLAAAFGRDPRLRVAAQVADPRAGAARARRLACDVLIVVTDGGAAAVRPLLEHLAAAPAHPAAPLASGASSIEAAPGGPGTPDPPRHTMQSMAARAPGPDSPGGPGTPDPPGRAEGHQMADGRETAAGTGEAARALPRLLVLAGEARCSGVLEALRLGVHGYGILTTLFPDELCAGVLAVARHGLWLCPRALPCVVAAAAGAAAERAPGAGPPAPVRSSHDGYGPLSEREAAVLRLIAAGTREERAAQELHLSRNTVKTYLRRVCAKLDAPSRAAAIRVAIERGLIPDRRRAAR